MPLSQPQSFGYQSESEEVVVRRVSRRVAHYIDDLKSRPDLRNEKVSETPPPREFADEAPTQVLKARKDENSSQEGPDSAALLPQAAPALDSSEAGAVNSLRPPPEVTIEAPEVTMRLGSVDGWSAGDESPTLRVPPPTLPSKAPPPTPNAAAPQGPEKERLPLTDKLESATNESATAPKSTLLRVAKTKEGAKGPVSNGDMPQERAPVPDFPSLSSSDDWKREFESRDDENSETRKSFMFPQDDSRAASQGTEFASTVAAMGSDFSGKATASGVSTEDSQFSELPSSGGHLGLVVGIVTVIILAVVYYLLTFENFVY